jgi:hypothetical protein
MRIRLIRDDMFASITKTASYVGPFPARNDRFNQSRLEPASGKIEQDVPKNMAPQQKNWPQCCNARGEKARKSNNRMLSFHALSAEKPRAGGRLRNIGIFK